MLGCGGGAPRGYTTAQACTAVGAEKRSTPFGVGLAHGDELHCRRLVQERPGAGARGRGPPDVAPLEQLQRGLPKVADLLLDSLMTVSTYKVTAAPSFAITSAQGADRKGLS